MRVSDLPSIAIQIVCLVALAGCDPFSNDGFQSPVESGSGSHQVASRKLPFWSIANQAKWQPSDFFDTANELTICEAMSSSDMGKVTKLLQSGVELNTPGKLGVTVLHWAFFEDNLLAYELLLKNGASPDRKLDFLHRAS